MKVMVTGGAGYIGSHVVKILCDIGLQVVVFDNLSTGDTLLLDTRAEFVAGDLKKPAELESVFAKNKIGSVIHLAALTSVAESVRLPEKYEENNVRGTENLLKYCQKYLVKNFVFSSTAAVYADPGKEPVSEKSVVAPTTPYGQGKLRMEKAIQELSANGNMRSFILRYFNVSGACPDLSIGPMGVRTDLVKLASEVAVGIRSGIEITGIDYPTVDGTGVRDYIHVQDIAELHLSALSYLQAGGISELANCGYGHGYSVRQVIREMKQVSGRDFRVTETGRRPGDLAEVIADSRKIQKIFSWTPKYNDLNFICQTAYDWEVKNQKRTSARL